MVSENPICFMSCFADFIFIFVNKSCVFVILAQFNFLSLKYNFDSLYERVL